MRAVVADPEAFQLDRVRVAVVGAPGRRLGDDRMDDRQPRPRCAGNTPAIVRFRFRGHPVERVFRGQAADGRTQGEYDQRGTGLVSQRHGLPRKRAVSEDALPPGRQRIRIAAPLDVSGSNESSPVV